LQPSRTALRAGKEPALLEAFGIQIGLSAVSRFAHHLLHVGTSQPAAIELMADIALTTGPAVPVSPGN